MARQIQLAGADLVSEPIGACLKHRQPHPGEAPPELRDRLTTSVAPALETVPTCGRPLSSASSASSSASAAASCSSTERAWRASTSPAGVSRTGRTSRATNRVFDLAFERCDLLGHRGLGVVERLRRRGEGPAVGELDEQPEPGRGWHAELECSGPVTAVLVRAKSGRLLQR
jgi:hypothetical protein